MVHLTQKKRSLTVSDDNGVVSSTTITTANPNPKKLKRLPHVFAKVLELPFNSNADVFVEETEDSFLFIAESASSDDDITIHVIKILPGVTKIAVLRVAHGCNVDSCEVDEVDIDTWRFRLPSNTCPEMASAMCNGGQLIVTVPKAVNVEDMVRDYNQGDGNERDDEDENRNVDNAKESLFLVE